MSKHLLKMKNLNDETNQTNKNEKSKSVTPLFKINTQTNKKLSAIDKLSRETAITSSQNYTVRYDDLVNGDLLGRGEFSYVKKMFHPQSNLTFAVKVINVKTVYQMMTNENKYNSKLMDLEVPKKLGDKCPFLIRFYGAIYAEGDILILTELMDTSLEIFYMKVFSLQNQFPELVLSKVAYAVVEALKYMKMHNILHRDIKPSNILINSTGEIKVCDFGISGFTINSVCRSYKGCLCYMAPEKIDPNMKSYSIKADIWSLGISLIEIATGVHPFEGTDFFKLMRTITSDEESPSLDTQKFSQPLCQFVNKCLIKDAACRPNCDDLLKEPFLTSYINESLDLEYIENVINEVKKDKLE